MMARTLKYILWFIVLAMLSLPLLQMKFGLFELDPLHGSFEKVENVSFDLNSWFEGEYQDKKENYYKENLGFRSSLVRIKNQYEYSFFNKSNANGVIIGRKKYLYNDDYIKTHLGIDYLGAEYIQNKVWKLKRVADTLKTKGVDLMVIFPPGKGSYYPEYFPNKYKIENKVTSNYDSYSSELAKTNIHYLDFNKWFREMKDTSRYQLYPKNSIHWSTYGAFLAADSIIHYIEKLKQRDLAKLELHGMEVSKEARLSDQDIEDAMNLLFGLTDEELLYPDFTIAKDSSLKKTKVLSIADSFYWVMYNWKLSKDVFDNGQFWYYNEKIYAYNYKEDRSIKKINYTEELEKNDVIMLICTDRNLYKFAYGFIDRAYQDYYGESEEVLSEKEKRIRYLMDRIKGNDNWYQKVCEKADIRGSTYQQSLRKEAEYLYFKEMKKR